MTEEVIDVGLQDQNGSQNIVDNQQESKPQATENMIPASRMNDIIHERTRQASQKAYERGRSEADSSRQATSMGGMPQMTEDQLRQMMQNVFQEQQSKLQEDFRKQEVQRQLDELAGNYMGKLKAAGDKYPDLVKRQNEISEFSSLIPYINESDETAAITQHLLDNGHNVASLMVLAHTSPTLLRRELQKLANSIKQNEDARARPHVNEPLYQPTPSTYTTDSGSDSIESLKRQPWLRG